MEPKPKNPDHSLKQTPLKSKDVKKFGSDIEKMFAFAIAVPSDLPYPCSVNKLLRAENICLEITASVYVDKAKTEPYAHNITLKIDEYEPITTTENELYDFIIVSHALSIENGKILYSVNYYLIDEVNELTIGIDVGPIDKQSYDYDGLKILDEPVLTKEILDELMKKASVVLNAQANE